MHRNGFAIGRIRAAAERLCEAGAAAGRRARGPTERAMTFNEGMQIDTSRTSSSGGGGGGRRIAVGGGVGGLLIMVVALFLGVDPGGVLSEQPAQNQTVAPGFDLTKCRTGAD